MVDPAVVVPDEFASIAAHAESLGVGIPNVRRVGTGDDPGALSGLSWGAEPPEWLFVHGGMQNSHTWNAVLLRAGLDALALDLPGHGRSARFDDGYYGVERIGDSLACSLDAFSGRPVTVVGHSLGAMASLSMVARHPHLARSLILVDAEPIGFGEERPRSVPTMEPVGTFEELLAMGARRTGRREEDVRRGVLMNARPRPDGLWEWRWDPRIRDRGADRAAESARLVRDLERLEIPVALVRGSRSPFVSEESAARFAEHVPAARLAVAPDAGHNVQTDAAEWLAHWLTAREFDEESG